MTHIHINTQIRSVHDVFVKSQAFVVPEYQRAYQWGESQVLGLIRDIYLGTFFLSKSTNTDNEIRFLGSIITIVPVDAENSYGKFQPNLFHQIVDGQQRLTTFSLLAAVIFKRLRAMFEELEQSNYEDDIKVNMKKVHERYEKTLKSVYEYKCNQMFSNNSEILLPAIIRAENDLWEDNLIHFQSPVASMLYKYINSPKEISLNKDIVSKNIVLMDNMLNKIENGHFPKDHNIRDDAEEPYEFPIHEVVLKLGEQLWHGDYPVLRSLVATESMNISTQTNLFVRIVRILTFANVFLHRCYVNHVWTKEEKWAFDMFIGLNTSGIPLSAVETFRAYMLKKSRELPLNLSKEVKIQIQLLFVDSKNGIEEYIDREKKVNERMKRTKEYVTAFALYMDGQKVSFDLHEQRQYLKKIYDSRLNGIFDNVEKQKKQLEFVNYMKWFTQYFVQYDSIINQTSPVIEGLMSVDESSRDAAMLALGFLDDSSHVIVQPLLARFYEKVIRKFPESAEEFVKICLAVVAFFSLWKPIYGTNGLPDIYRTLMNKYVSVTNETQAWNSRFVKKFLINKLISYDNSSNSFDHTIRDAWVAAASSSIRAKRMKELSRFILLVVSHQTHKDEVVKGLMKEAANGYQPYLTLGHWLSDDLKSIEHIAPQTKSEGWDDRLYDPASNLVDSLGNLVLMPTDLNSSLQNKTWGIKWTYYRYVALGHQGARDKFVETMKQNGVNLQKPTLKLLGRAMYAGHMDPIVAVGQDGTWDAELVEKRTRRMLEIFHDRMMQWLQD